MKFFKFTMFSLKPTTVPEGDACYDVHPSLGKSTNSNNNVTTPVSITAFADHDCLVSNTSGNDKNSARFNILDMSYISRVLY